MEIQPLESEFIEPAPLGKRFAAFAIDAVLFLPLLWAVSHLIYAFGIQFPELVWLVVFPPVAAFGCYLVGNTPGKRFLGLRIVDAKTGAKPSTLQFLGRAIPFCLLISFNVLLIIPVLLSKKRQAIHDMISGTMVIEG